MGSKLSGTGKLRGKKVEFAANYAVEYCPDPIWEEGWENGTYNTAAQALVTGLTRGNDYWFRVLSMGAESTKSNWSDPAVQLVN